MQFSLHHTCSVASIIVVCQRYDARGTIVPSWHARPQLANTEWMDGIRSQHPMAILFRNCLQEKTWKEAWRLILLRQLLPSGGWPDVSDAGCKWLVTKFADQFFWPGTRIARICWTEEKNRLTHFDRGFPISYKVEFIKRNVFTSLHAPTWLQRNGIWG